MYRILTILSLVLVFGTSTVMSISGLLSIFSKNTYIIICMGLGMEGGKILTISHLYRSWRHYNFFLRTVYVFMVFVLIILTSFEVCGYLFNCYQKTFQSSHVLQSQIDALADEEFVLNRQINIIDTTLKGLPESHVSRRIQERENSGYSKKQNRLLEINKKKSALEIQLITLDENLNPVSFIAKILQESESKIILIFILVLVLILEPLTIGLTIATNAVWLNSNNQNLTHKEVPKKRKDLTKELRDLQKENDLSVSQIAAITGRKKLKTCKGWIEGTIPTPPRVLIEIRRWIDKHKNPQNPSSLIK